MALAERLARQMVEHDRRAGQIVEERVEPLVEERQPVLHAGKAAALADGGIERVVARRRAEGRDVAAAEAADRLGRQRHLAHRPAASSALRWPVVRWVATSKARIDSSVSPKKSRRSGLRARRARRGRGCRRARRIRRPRAPSRRGRSRSSPAGAISAFMSTWLPGRARKVCASIAAAGGMRCSSALTVVRMTARCGCLRKRDHAGHGVEAARRGVGAGRDAVVGQAVPGREFQHRQVGRDEGERVDDGRQALAVAGDEDDRRRRALSRAAAATSAKAS